ncbi:MAG TPA: hypothetical protein EYP52_10350, partial [Anaerolineae bacterium]|nr:hypothetical protein [Anaerolineae bacterium]
MRERWLICLTLGMAAVALWALYALLLGLAPARADPGLFFVKPDGTGTDCSQTNPCSLQEALSQAADGDTIYLAQGTYAGTGLAVISIYNDTTLLGGWDGTTTTPPVRDPHTYTTTLDGEGQRQVVYISGGDTVLDGLWLTNGSGFLGGGVYAANAQVVISGCHIFSN